MNMLDNDLSYGQLKFFIKEIYFYVLNCSKQGLLPSKVSLLGEIPLIPHEGEMNYGVSKTICCI